jgi:hypothetical protein
MAGIYRKATPPAVENHVRKLARARRIRGEKRHYVGARRVRQILSQIALES